MDACPAVESLDHLEAEIRTLSASIHAATCRLLLLIAEFDAREGWSGWGMRSCAHWLNLRCGIGMVAAREKVRVAHALTDLPRIRESFSRGELSYSKVRALTRIATPEKEADLLQIAHHATAAHVEKYVRKVRWVQRQQELEAANTRHAKREVTWYWDEDGSLVLHGRLPPEAGRLVLQALDAAAQSLPGPRRRWDQVADEASSVMKNDALGEGDARGEGDDVRHSGADTVAAAAPHSFIPDDDVESLPAVRRADALAALAETFLAGGPRVRGGAERTMLHVVVDAAVLEDAAEDGCCSLDDGPALPPETVRRLGCDASVVHLCRNPRADGDGDGDGYRDAGIDAGPGAGVGANGDGDDDDRGASDDRSDPLQTGRRTRTIPASVRRALDRRDDGCRYPGCTHRHYVDAHHIEHWADGGSHRLDNLVLLCTFHHRLVHEGGFRVSGDANGSLTFYRADGRAVPQPGDDSAESFLEVEEGNARHGVVADAHTYRCLWDGQRMDYHMAVEGYFQSRN